VEVCTWATSRARLACADATVSIQSTFVARAALS
jgi:hypothetical protein